MTTFTSFNVKSNSKLFENHLNWEHNLPTNEWEYWNLLLNEFKIQSRFKQQIKRVRMISPTSWVTDRKEFRKQVSKYREHTKDKSSSDKDTNDELKSLKMVDPLHLDAMK